MKWSVLSPQGPFRSVAEAARGEGEVDWTAPEGPAHEACTLSFAAAEATEFLSRVPGVQAEAGVVEDASPEAPFIAVLTPTALEAADGWVSERFGRVRPPEAEQSFAIRTIREGEASGYLVLGRDRAGALYGTYELLRRLGFRWLGPDDHDTHVPGALPRPLPDLDLSQSPSFITRGFHGGEDRGSEAFLLWMARNKLNLWFAAQSNKPFCRKLCLKFLTGGHSIYHRYAPPEKYFADHPEWYCLKDGERRGEIERGFGYNVCFSNAEVRRQLAENMVEDLISGENRWTDIMQVWPLDNGVWCECEGCRRLGNPTDQILLLAHDCRQAILRARREGRLGRDVRVNIPAYHETLPIPTKELPPGFDHAGTLVIFFTIERCYSHPIDDPACTEINAGLARFLKDWRENPDCPFRGEMFIGEYYNVSSFASLAIPFARTMAVDIPFYHAVGARHLNYMHVTTAHWGTLSLTNAQFAAQLWDHRLDCRAFFEDYLDHRYRGHSEAMGRFYDLLEQAMRNSKPLKHYAGLEKPRHCLFPILRQKGSSGSPLTIFTSEHLPYAPTHRLKNDGPSLLETLRILDEAERVLDQVFLEVTDATVARRLADDVRRFRYTRSMVQFLYRLIRVRLLENQDDPARAGLEARALRDVGEALRREDLVMRFQQGDRPHNRYENGLTATWFARAYAEVMADYGLETPDTPGGRLPEGGGKDTHLP